MDNITEFKITQSENTISEGHYDLLFQLSEQQQYASEQLYKQLKRFTHYYYMRLLVRKTEMMYEGIRVARQLGFNVAIVSPRVDVVVEISLRIKEAFISEDIDVLHQSSQQQYNGHFIVATVHQLFRFKSHFDVIFIDEVDAFPLSMDPRLMEQFGYHQNKNIATYL